MLRTTYNILAASYTSIPALRFSRRVEIEEDANGGTQSGLLVKFPDDNFTNVIGYSPDQQPVILGSVPAEGKGAGPLIGIPAQSGYPAKSANVYCMIQALTGDTVIHVTEWD